MHTVELRYINYKPDTKIISSTCLPEIIQVQAAKYTSINDRNRFVLGKLLLKRYLDIQGASDSISLISYTPYGKPFICDGIHFNTSHTTDIIIIAASKYVELGLDIEAKDRFIDINKDIIFNIEEINWIDKNINLLNPLTYLWTRKEAVLKTIGYGLYQEMNTINTLQNPILLDNNHYYWKEIDIDTRYYCHLSIKSELNSISYTISEDQLSDLI